MIFWRTIGDETSKYVKETRSDLPQVSPVQQEQYQRTKRRKEKKRLILKKLKLFFFPCVLVGNMCCRQYICFVKWGAALFTYPKNVTPSWGSPLASLTRLIVPVIWVYMWVWGQQLLPFLIWLEIQSLCSPGKWWKFLALNLKWSPWCQALRWDCGWGSQGHSRGGPALPLPRPQAWGISFLIHNALKHQVNSLCSGTI